MTEIITDFLHEPVCRDNESCYHHANDWKNLLLGGSPLHIFSALGKKLLLNEQPSSIFIEQSALMPRQISASSPGEETGESNESEAGLGAKYAASLLRKAKNLLAENGSIFIRTDSTGLPHLRLPLDQIFGKYNFISQIVYGDQAPHPDQGTLPNHARYILWYAKNRQLMKFNRLFLPNPSAADTLSSSVLVEKGAGDREPRFFHGQRMELSSGHWRFDKMAFNRLALADRIGIKDNKACYLSKSDDFPYEPLSDIWTDSAMDYRENVSTVIQERAIERCLLMTSDPGDLVVAPAKIGSEVAEKWGRRWIAITNSRTALKSELDSLVGARYPFYLLQDNAATSDQGNNAPANSASAISGENPAKGFVYQHAPRISAAPIAANEGIDAIWAKRHPLFEGLLSELNGIMGEKWEEWEIPKEPSSPWPKEAADLHGILGKAYKVKMPVSKTAPLLKRLNEILKSRFKKIEQLPALPETPWPEKAAQIHAKWFKELADQRNEINAIIASTAPCEILYNRPIVDETRQRLTGPFKALYLPHDGAESFGFN